MAALFLSFAPLLVGPNLRLEKERRVPQGGPKFYLGGFALDLTVDPGCY